MDDVRDLTVVIDISTYCRDVEAYLCRKNGGHLIRVVGPAFDLVKGWAELGIPLSVVQDGIDRTIERASRTVRRRRPIPIAFCEGDVLDGFERWRRAVGVNVEAPGTKEASARRGTLAAHVERVAAHLASWLSGRAASPLTAVVAEVAEALVPLAAPSATARGAARDEILTALATLDRRLLDAAEAALPPERRARLTREAETELEAFRGRLAPPQWQTAVATTCAQAVRRESGLPAVRFD